MTEERPKKLPPGSVKFELLGDLLRLAKVNSRENLPIRKYEDLAEALVEKPKDDRFLLYKFLCGLALTAHARRTPQEAPRKVIFDVKNEIFLSIVNNFANRKVLNFRLCVSPRFKVTKYCSDCEKTNKESNTDFREWKFCKKCEVDRSYFNVLSVFHRFPEGSAALFLGQDMLDKVFPIRELKKVPLGKFKEEVVYKNFHFSPKNLQAARLDSVIEVCEKLLKLAPQTLIVDPERMKRGGGHGLLPDKPDGRSKAGRGGPGGRPQGGRPPGPGRKGPPAFGRGRPDRFSTGPGEKRPFRPDRGQAPQTSAPGFGSRSQVAGDSFDRADDSKE